MPYTCTCYMHAHMCRHAIHTWLMLIACSQCTHCSHLHYTPLSTCTTCLHVCYSHLYGLTKPLADRLRLPRVESSMLGVSFPSLDLGADLGLHSVGTQAPQTGVPASAHPF